MAVTVTTDGRTESRRVDVVAEPLLLDAHQITLVTEWNDLPVQYDASHNRMGRDNERICGVRSEGFPERNRGIRRTHLRPRVCFLSPVTEATIGCRPSRADAN
jgi:hypothetical protein